MVNEHAITIKDKMSIEDINYIIRKANRLGLRDREVTRVFSRSDEHGAHIYFECDSLKHKNEDTSEIIIQD